MGAKYLKLCIIAFLNVKNIAFVLHIVQTFLVLAKMYVKIYLIISIIYENE